MNSDNFASIDRLVEFGLGMAVAQQMVNSMNHALQNSHVPGAHNPLQPPRSYHAVLDDHSAGPFSESELSRLITEGRLTKATPVWRPGMPKWEPAQNVPEVLRLVALCPPPFQPEA